MQAKLKDQQRKPKKSTKPAAKVLPFKSRPFSDDQTRLKNRLLAKLSESGLGIKDAEMLNLQPCTTAQSQTLGLSRSGEGMKIPYYDMQAKLLSMFRYRFFDTVATSGFLKGAKLPRYNQPPNTPMEIYLPRGEDWEAVAADSDKKLIIVEGELKAACANKNGFLTVGLGGVWSFGRGAGDLRLHKTLAAFKWKNRSVYICYDSDAVGNTDVMRAENRLASTLLDAGALVYIVRIPPDGDAKVGLDDFIVKSGADAFTSLMDSTQMWCDSRELHELNGLYVVCRNPAAIYEVDTGVMHSRQEFVEILEAPRTYTQMDADGKRREIQAAKEWIKWPARSEVKGVTYEPGAERISKGHLNMWVDPCIEPREGNTAPFDDLLAYLMPDEEQRKWLWQWAAYPLQQPGGRNNVAVLLWSQVQGQGKTLIGETIGWLHGKANYIEITQKVLESDFNDWQPRHTYIMGSELCGTSARDARAFEDQLKSLITPDTINVHEKYLKKYTVPNCANYFLTSNRPTALHLTKEARRFFVVHATEAKQPQEVYTRFLKWREDGGLRYLLYKMLHIDLTDFNPGADAPQTQDMMEMVANDRSDLQDWCHEIHEDSQSVLRRNGLTATIAKTRFATTEQLMHAYLARTPHARVTHKQLTMELKGAGFVQANDGVQIRIGERRERLWIMRDFDNAAKLTLKKIGDEWLKSGGGR